MGNPFKVIAKGLKFVGKGAVKVGKEAYEYKEVIAMFVPYGSLVSEGVDQVEALIKGGQDPGTGKDRREIAIGWIRAQLPEKVRDNPYLAVVDDDELADLIRLEVIRRKRPHLFAEMDDDADAGTGTGTSDASDAGG